MPPGPDGPLVHARDLEVRYQRGPEAAVRDVALDLAAGEGLLLVGGPGSGKSSVLRGVLGLAPAAGEVRLLGGRPGDPRALRQVGYAPQRWPFVSGLRVGEVVRLVARVRGLDDPQGAAADAMRRAGLKDPSRSLERLEVEDVRRTALAAALTGRPRLLVLDDPWEFEETEREVRAALDRGAGVLAASGDPGGLPALLGRTLALADGAPAA